MQKTIKRQLPEKTKEEAEAFIRKIMGPPRRHLQGLEKEQTLTMLALIQPTVTSNNQHSWSEDYIQGGKHWEVTYFPDGDVIVAEVEIE